MSTTLCPDCQAISLDDEKLGGTTCTPDDGKPYLFFGRDVEGSEGHFSIEVAGYREDELPDLPGLQLSAANGCALCGLLRSAVLSEFPQQEVGGEDPDTPSKTLVLKDFGYQWHSLEDCRYQKGTLAYLALLSVNAVVRSGDDDQLYGHIYFEVCAPPGPLATWLRIPWNVADENAFMSPGRIRDIKSWISDCEQHCHHAGITAALPTRLIEVGSEDGRDQVRLILSSDIPTIHHGTEFCKYTTLSYCWGDQTDKPFFTTQKSTIQQMLQSIPMESLPKTCRDAVTVTRSLGIRYLWIDALCIVQDDSKDWAKESAIMGQIYTNSWLTLIALRGDSCHDGFLDRKIAMKVPMHYKSSVKPDVNGVYWLRQVSNGYTEQRRDFGDSAVLGIDESISRWNSRGWTLQEDKLSTRKLIFGTEKVYYQCGADVRVENTDGCLMLKGYSRPFLDFLLRNPFPRAHYAAWYDVVGLCGFRNLTYSTDRLPAISGLAQTIHERRAGNYLAGLWQSDLFNGLLWIRFPRTRPVMSGEAFVDSVVNPKHYTAPSWSWGRSKQGIGFVCRLPPYPENTSEIKVLEAKTALTGPNPFGGVKDGHLLLRGKTFGLKGTRIFGVDGKKVDDLEWLKGNIWLEAISHNGFEIARCLLDWETTETVEGLELPEAPWDQLMMLIIASRSKDGEDEEVDKDEEVGKDVEKDKLEEENEECEENKDEEEDKDVKEEGKHEEDLEGEEDEEIDEDETDESNEGRENDNDDMDDKDKDKQIEQDGEDSTDSGEDEENNGPEAPREYFGLLLLPTTKEANSWVRVGVFMLRGDEKGRTVLNSFSEKVVRIV